MTLLEIRTVCFCIGLVAIAELLTNTPLRRSLFKEEEPEESPVEEPKKEEPSTI